MVQATQIEREARAANSPDKWDDLWTAESEGGTWRREALSQVYTRIARLMPKQSEIVDIGGGIGILGDQLQKHDHRVWVWDHCPAALIVCDTKGLIPVRCDLEDTSQPWIINSDVVMVGTEILEHLSEASRSRVLSHATRAFFSVPNDRLDHDDEDQHTISFTPLEFKQYLGQFFDAVRVEVLGPYLLGVCGFPKPYTLSVTLPVRDEAADIEKTLASFRGIADEIVVGVDPRTTDNTRELAAKYAEVVFDLENPTGPGDDIPEKGVHFAWVRNQCMDRCTGDWIFMTEGHEILATGEDVLLALDKVVPEKAKVGYVLRTGNGQRWGFPWLCKNEPTLRYKRATHNILDIPAGTFAIKLPQVTTLHERADERSEARTLQRKVQNRKNLLEDWLENRNENSLFYLGQEWRATDEPRGLHYLTKFLATSNNGPARYQARLMLAKLHVRAGDTGSARAVLDGCAADDWSRIEHWIWLGDLAFEDDQFEQALQFYRYAGTSVNEPPFTLWWIDLSMYGYLAAQRLAMCYGELNRFEEALLWAEKVRELLPDDAPAEVFDEATRNVDLLKEVLQNGDDH